LYFSLSFIFEPDMAMFWLQLLATVLAPLVLAQNNAPWMNTSLSPRQRAEALAVVMTWEEKVGQMGGIRRLLAANVTFNQITFDTIHKYQNGQIGKTKPPLVLMMSVFTRPFRLWV
jgi:hypothetical protein